MVACSTIWTDSEMNGSCLQKSQVLCRMCIIITLDFPYFFSDCEKYIRNLKKKGFSDGVCYFSGTSRF